MVNLFWSQLRKYDMYLTFENSPGTYMVDLCESVWPVPRNDTIRFNFGNLSAGASDILGCQDLGQDCASFLWCGKDEQRADGGTFLKTFRFRIPLFARHCMTNFDKHSRHWICISPPTSQLISHWWKVCQWRCRLMTTISLERWIWCKHTVLSSSVVFIDW